MNNCNRKTRRRSRGVILLVTMLMMAVSIVLVTSMLSMGQNSTMMTRNWKRQDMCLLAAQSVLEKTVADIQAKFATFYNTSPSWGRLAWFNSSSATSVGGTGSASMPTAYAYGGFSVTVRVVNSARYGLSKGRVTLVSTATSGNATRSVTAVVDFGLEPSKVFDYAYFINNFGWFYGSAVTANGDVRANGNFDFSGSPTVNGNLYAGVNTELGAAGNVTGSGVSTPQSLSSYYSSSGNLTRPGNPTSSGGTAWPMGYAGTSDKYQQIQPLTMPYLGDLSDYQSMASTKGGTLQIADSKGKYTTVTTNGTYSGVGPSGLATNPDNGTLVLDGSTYPIKVSGPVVITGDVMIKGQIQGQGTIYSGRNIHIANNITYVNGPSWSKPDTKPSQTANTNSSKDLVCFAAKGNIVLGDYRSSDWLSSCDYYLSPPFVNAYTTDPTDASIGYDSDKNSSNGFTFAGDYTVNEVTGGKKVTTGTGSSATTASRKYYESSNDSAFGKLSPTNGITRLDGVFYTNHFFAGRVGAISINGSIVARDEGIIFSGSAKFNWDIRLGSKSNDSVGIDIFPPLSLGLPTIRYWRSH